MSYASLFVGVLIIILLVIVAYRVLSPTPPDGRKLWHDAEGNVVAIGERQGTAAGYLNGRGSETSAPLQLAAGTYRIDYQFDALTRVALIDANGDETLFIKRGEGTEALTIAETGRYRLLIEPADENATWNIAYRPVGALPANNDNL